MVHVVETSSSSMIPSFIKSGSGIQKLKGGIYVQTHRQQGDLIRLLLFFQNKESRPKLRFIIHVLSRI
jgi:hypothetical protein